MTPEQRVNKSIHIAYKNIKKTKKSKSPFVSTVFVVWLFLVIMLVGFDVDAAQCLKFSNNFTAENNQTYVVHFGDVYPLDGCPYEAILTSQEYARFQLYEEQNGQMQQITALEIAEAFTWGFGTYIAFWFLGYTIKNARMVIRKA